MSNFLIDSNGLEYFVSKPRSHCPGHSSVKTWTGSLFPLKAQDLAKVRRLDFPKAQRVDSIFWFQDEGRLALAEDETNNRAAGSARHMRAAVLTTLVRCVFISQSPSPSPSQR